jgi:hypothetical protein
MPIVASNYVIAPQQEEVVFTKKETEISVENGPFVITGSDWRSQIDKIIENNHKPTSPVVSEPVIMKPRNKKSTVLVEYRQSLFINDMLSIDEQ